MILGAMAKVRETFFNLNICIYHYSRPIVHFFNSQYFLYFRASLRSFKFNTHLSIYSSTLYYRINPLTHQYNESII